MRRNRNVSETGFTLVELMVALALAAVISVSIMFISTQAREAYQATISKIDVYNRFRFALNSVEKDLKNWIPTADLEFYTDGRGRGARRNEHWDPGEELPDRRDDDGPGVVDGGVPGEYDEYAQIVQRQYLSDEGGAIGETKFHDAYEIYFRTLTYVDGAVRLANVEYKLLDPNYGENNGTTDTKPLPPREVPRDKVRDLTLYKIVRYHFLTYDSLNNLSNMEIRRKIVPLSNNVTDFRVEYMIDKDFRGRVNSGFRTPEADYIDPLEQATRPTQLGNQGGDLPAYRKVFGYGSVRLDARVERATAFPGRQGDDGLAPGGGGGEHSPLRLGFQGNPRISFAELVPGDSIFVFTASSRGEAAPGTSGAGGGVAGNASALVRFPSGDYTVKTNLSGLLEFEEDIDASSWGGQPQNEIFYKAAYLPAGLRLTMRIVDDKGENPKSLQREIWLRRRSR